MSTTKTNAKGRINNPKTKTTHRESILSSEEFLNPEPIDYTLQFRQLAIDLNLAEINLKNVYADYLEK